VGGRTKMIPNKDLENIHVASGRRQKCLFVSSRGPAPSRYRMPSSLVSPLLCQNYHSPNPDGGC